MAMHAQCKSRAMQFNAIPLRSAPLLHVAHKQTYNTQVGTDRSQVAVCIDISDEISCSNAYHAESKNTLAIVIRCVFTRRHARFSTDRSRGDLSVALKNVVDNFSFRRDVGHQW